jgi:hypothetical protein
MNMGAFKESMAGELREFGFYSPSAPGTPTVKLLRSLLLIPLIMIVLTGIGGTFLLIWYIILDVVINRDIADAGVGSIFAIFYYAIFIAVVGMIGFALSWLYIKLRPVTPESPPAAPSPPDDTTPPSPPEIPSSH